MEMITHRKPRKKLGQHFLCDSSIIDRIVKIIAPKAEDLLIEIGPGQGALTLPVLKKAKSLIAIELDRDLIHELKIRAHHNPELIIYESDALTFDFAQLKKNKRLLRLFGNLPYNISTPLIFHLLKFRDIISDMTFMLQKEVAERICAKPGSKNFSRLSVMVQYHCEVDILMDISGAAFYPQPQVKSSIVKFVPFKKNPYAKVDYTLFESVVRHAFNQRRKTLRNSLKDIVSDEVWAQIELHSDLRPQDLTVEDFVAICNAISKQA